MGALVGSISLHLHSSSNNNNNNNNNNSHSSNHHNSRRSLRNRSHCRSKIKRRRGDTILMRVSPLALPTLLIMTMSRMAMVTLVMITTMRRVLQ